VLIDARTFEPLRRWAADGQSTQFGYDFWYQPRQNVMLSTEWGTPNRIAHGFDPANVAAGERKKFKKKRLKIVR
jgi:selenium-binding protein 1